MDVVGLQVWALVQENLVLQLNRCILLGLGSGKKLFHPTLINLTQTSSDVGESQHEPSIKICKDEKVVKLH